MALCWQLDVLDVGHKGWAECKEVGKVRHAQLQRRSLEKDARALLDQRVGDAVASQKEEEGHAEGLLEHQHHV